MADTKQISDMTDYELNEAIAFEVMGWHIDEFGYWMDADDEHTGYIAIEHPTMGWIPTADLNQVIKCAEKFKGYEILKSCYRKDYSVKVWEKFGEVNRCAGKIISDNPARAMCEATLMAKRAK